MNTGQAICDVEILHMIMIFDREIWGSHDSLPAVFYSLPKEKKNRKNGEKGIMGPNSINFSTLIILINSPSFDLRKREIDKGIIIIIYFLRRPIKFLPSQCK